MSDRNEKLEDDQNDEKKNSEASGCTIKSDPPLAEGSKPFNLRRIRNFVVDNPTETLPKEIIETIEGIQNMSIAHEIALDQNFRINKIEPEDNTLHKKVKDILHKMYWDILANELSQTPPVYTQALQLLEEIKQYLDELLLPHNAKMKENLKEVLDIALIKQQVENGVLDFSKYAHYVISIMEKICAPIRDERILELKKCTDVIETFKGIMEVLDLMKLDLTNFTINMFRPSIVASSVEYEKLKFDEFLKVQKDGLKNTRKWLLLFYKPELVNAISKEPDYINRLTEYLLIEAYLSLLEFNVIPNAETLMLDQGRIIDLRNRTSRLIINGSILIVLGCLPYILSDQLKNTIKDHMMVLLESVNSNEDLEAVMPNILVQIKADIQKEHDSINNVKNPEEGKTLSIFENQIIDLSKPDHAVRKLTTTRIKHYFKNVILSQSSNFQFPGEFSLLQKEMSELGMQLMTLFTRNKLVFIKYYQQIVTEAVKEKQEQ